MLEYKLRQKIKTILEGLTPDELKDLEQKYQEEISKTQTVNLEEGWNMLDLVIQKLCEVDIVQYTDLFKKYEKLEEVLKSLGFKKIGEGAFRDVWSNNSVDFIVKLEKSQYGKAYQGSGANKAERKKYFEFGSDFQPRNDMFPKLYAYDQLDNMWLIFEKVNTFEYKKKELVTKMFSPIFNLLQKVIKYVDNDPFFKNIEIENKIYQINLRKDKVNEFKDVVSPYSTNISAVNALWLIWDDSFLEKMAAEMKTSGDIQHAFEKTIVYFIEGLFTMSTDYEINKGQKNKEIKSIILKKLKSHFKSELTATPDVVWIANMFKHNWIEDMHAGNLGWRSLKNNPNEPWKNFVILDFGEYGDKGANYSGTSNPISGPGSSIKNFPFKHLSF